MLDLLLTPADAEQLLAERVRAERRRRGWTQADLAERSGLSVPTISRLESKGHGQLRTVLLVLTALGRLADVEGLLKPPAPTSLDELRRS